MKMMEIQAMGQQLWRLCNNQLNCRKLHWYCSRSISNGATGKVNVAGGVNAGQTGLQMQNILCPKWWISGTSAGNPSVVAGTSISGTQIIVKG